MIQIEVRGLKQLVEKLDANKLVGPPLKKAFNSAVLLLEREAKKRSPVDTGRLRSSITHEVDSRTVPLWGRIGTDVKYAPYVELGTRPHWPPLSALQPWARRHGFPPGRSGAFLVARAISRRGTKAREFFKGALETNIGRIQGFFNRAAKGIEDIFGGK